MITKEIAKEIALNKITKDILTKSVLSNGEVNKGIFPVIYEDTVKEYKWGWLFFYNSSKYFESGNDDDSYFGNAPLFVSKVDATTKYIGFSLEGNDGAIKQYCKQKGYDSFQEE